MKAELIPKVPSIPVIVARSGGLQKIFENLGERQKNWAQECGFTGKYGQILCLPDEEGALDAVLFGLGNDRERARGRLIFGKLAMELPSGNYHLVTDEEDQELAALAWLLSSYRFDQYKSNPNSFAKLVGSSDIDTTKINTIAQSCHIAMDLINRPANDLNPTVFAEEVQRLGIEIGMNVETVVGNNLNLRNFPMILAVGQASVHQPRLIEMNWGQSHDPKITIVGKGVCFDTGGLNIKPTSSMGTMKKDMGGAANALALARMIVELQLPVNLQVLLPIVENSISSNAMRPGDILTARNGMTVEVNNTDAEGRLIMADALSYGAERSPDLIISLATLTGAARVAVGADLVPYFTDNEELSAGIMAQAKAVEDPMWRLPFWDPYETMIEAETADLDNAPTGGMAGAITAALFLRRFTGNADYLHADLYGWSPSALPGRPKGGAAQGIRAIYAYLAEVYGQE